MKDMPAIRPLVLFLKQFLMEVGGQCLRHRTTLPDLGCVTLALPQRGFHRRPRLICRFPHGFELPSGTLPLQRASVTPAQCRFGCAAAAAVAFKQHLQPWSLTTRVP